MVLVFTFVFGVVFRARWGVEPTAKGDFVTIFLTGMIVHGLFAEALSRAPTLITSHSNYVKKVVFPLEILPAVTVLSAVITALIGLSVVVVMYFSLNGKLHPTILYLPAILIPYIVLLNGFVFIICAIGVYVRDMNQIIGFIVTIALFMTPIFYPITAVPEAFRHLLYINPLTFTVEQVRVLVLFGDAPDWGGVGIYTVAAFVVLFVGFKFFQRTRDGFADVL